jgi:hypothetical protein
VLRPGRSSLTFAAVALVTLSLAACGGASSDTIATVGKSTISKTTLNHWMTTVVGGDYHEVTGLRAPLGLVSEPANYPRCVSTASRIVAESEARPKLRASQLLLKCRQLHAAVKEQAVSYLIAVLWRAEEGVALHANVSEREVMAQLQGIEHQQFASPVAFRKYLADEQRTLADELYLLKRNLLDTKFLARLKQRTAALGGGEQTTQRLVQENIAHWSAKTDCSPHYLAWQCKQYGSRAAASPSAAVLLEQLHKGSA